MIALILRKCTYILDNLPEQASFVYIEYGEIDINITVSILLFLEGGYYFGN